MFVRYTSNGVILTHGIKTIYHECGSVVGAVTRYWLYNQGSFQFVTGATDACILRHVETSSGAYQPNCLLGTWDLYLQDKATRFRS